MYGPPPYPPRRSPYLIPVMVGGGIVVLFVAVLFVLGLTVPEAEEAVPAQSAPVSSRAPAAEPSARRAPHPTAAQEDAYLATIARIDPGLAVNRERAIRRARGVCDRIINPPGGTVTLAYYTKTMLSGGNAQITEAEAKKVIRAVKVWCR